ncbi:hypothetical protein MCU_01464 [Bartonella elizabethae Re6043vi]|uniref:Uncharacterized protein n=2 Tax=Bartonella elizabethae TaxID=807 RepID=J1K7V2_BAREL|nr:hypothetical protein MCU_01464 [Bartonella elizabethae Re6043vi]EJF93385.1 hypothetical protein MEE_01504 [Bartonella elizabethae F9251 = ATCC 49927]VEJ41832.1 Uncharacterised protein [Bartonella elizabethae]
MYFQKTPNNPASSPPTPQDKTSTLHHCANKSFQTTSQPLNPARYPKSPLQKHGTDTTILTYPYALSLSSILSSHPPLPLPLLPNSSLLQSCPPSIPISLPRTRGSPPVTSPFSPPLTPIHKRFHPNSLSPFHAMPQAQTTPQSLHNRSILYSFLRFSVFTLLKIYRNICTK